MLFLDILRSAFRAINVLHEGQGLNLDDISDGMYELNTLLDEWNTERLYIYTILRSVFPLTAAKSIYTIGPAGGDFTATRPTLIERAGVLLVGNGSQPLEMPVTVVQADGWADVQLKNVTANLTDTLFYQPTYPLGTVNLWPVPVSSTNQLALYVWQQLTQVANETVTVQFPPGYAECLIYNLAVKCAAQWSKPLRPDVLALANSYKQAVQSLNRNTLDVAVKLAAAKQAEAQQPQQPQAPPQ